MDTLIKKNIIKKSKIIVDIGSKYTKLLGVSYTAKKITIINSHKFDSSTCFCENTLTEVTEFTRQIERILGGNKNHEFSISVPSSAVEYKIVSIKNKKISELGKIIEREHITFGKVSPITHEIDYAYLGTREENGDNVHYCLVSAISKNTVNQLIDEFAKRKMRVTTVSFPVYDLICFSQLFHDDYEHLNRLAIDFGTNETRIVAFADGVPVYARNIGVGFNTYVDKLFSMQETVGKPDLIKTIYAIGETSVLTSEQIRKYFSGFGSELYFEAVNEISSQLSKDIFRVIEMCESNNVAITKIICSGFIINDFEKRLTSKGLEVKKFNLNLQESASGMDFIIQLGEANVDSNYNNAIGLAMQTLI